MNNKHQKPSTVIKPPQLPKKPASTALPEGRLSDQDTYTDLILSNYELAGQTADDVSFERVHFKHADLSHTRLTLLQLLDVRFDACDLTEADWDKASLCRVELNGCRMIGLKASEADLRDILVKGCNGTFAQFWSTTFKGARFEHCVLVEADFQGADLSGVVFDKCDLSNAKMSDARLAGADLRGSKIDGLRVGAKELQGAIVDPDQAIGIARLIGVIVKWD